MTHLQVVVFPRKAHYGQGLLRYTKKDHVTVTLWRYVLPDPVKSKEGPKTIQKDPYPIAQKVKVPKPCTLKTKTASFTMFLPKGPTSRCRHQVHECNSAHTLPRFLGIPRPTWKGHRPKPMADSERASEPETYLAKSVTRTGFAQPGKGMKKIEKVSRMDDPS